MAPRLASRPARENDFSDVGKVGRRTGITLAQGRLDVNGMEEISGIFSSPRKPSPLRKSMSAMDSIEETEMSEQSRGMTGMDSSRMTPSQALSARKSIPPPRSASPRKSGISGTARRSKTVDVLGQNTTQQDTTPDQRHSSKTPLHTPSLAASSAKRFKMDRTPQTDATGSRPQNAAIIQTMMPDSATQDESMPDIVAIEDTPSDAPEPTDMLETTDVAPVTTEIDEYVLPAMGDEDDDREASAAPAPDDDFEGSPLPPPFDDEEADETFEPEARAKPRSREPTIANSRRKRKSDAVEQELEVEAVSSPAAKRAKRISDQTIKRKKSSPKQPIEPAPVPTRSVKPSQSKGKDRSALSKKDTNPKLSKRQEGELNEIIEKVKARPGQKKSLYVLRRETPTEDGVTHTRSGRISVKPLAYWRNEKCVYGGSPGGASLLDGARFPLNSIKEIIRTEKVDKTPLKKSKARKTKGKRAQRDLVNQTEESNHDVQEETSEESDQASDQDSDSEAEPWETERGIFRGPTSTWDLQQQSPSDRQEETDIAYAAASIETREVKGSTFRYAKLLSSKFFGSGVVDLPPGAVKRPKNSRKMHMCFFVATGRVTVQVGPFNGEESRFSIGTGGWWQVPRGNQYSMENHSSSKSARIFFSQGCEVVLQDDEE